MTLTAEQSTMTSRPLCRGGTTSTFRHLRRLTTSRIPTLMVLLLLNFMAPLSYGFSSAPIATTAYQRCSSLHPQTTFLEQTTTDDESDSLIARRITVIGDVGGYYRACVINEASRFRRLVGTMTPPEDDSKKAEIYVEGTKKKVDGFVRWCERSKVGLGQSVRVESVVDEEPTGLYDGFYAKAE